MKGHISRYLILGFLFLNFSFPFYGQKSFSFVQLCDPQLGMDRNDKEVNSKKYYEQDKESFRNAVQLINELDVDFVIICGDFVQDANDTTFTDFKNIQNELKTRCYLVAGNHDIGNVPNDSSLNFYRKTFGKDYYKFRHKGNSFIITNSLFWKNNIENESEKHDKWFKKTIKKEGNKEHPVFVVGHFPLYTKHPEEEENYYNFPLCKRQELLNLFKQNNVVAYLSGHKHKLIINNYGVTQFVSGETTSFNFDDCDLGFRLWEVSEDTIRHTFISLVTANKP